MPHLGEIKKKLKRFVSVAKANLEFQESTVLSKDVQSEAERHRSSVEETSLGWYKWQKEIVYEKIVDSLGVLRLSCGMRRDA